MISLPTDCEESAESFSNNREKTPPKFQKNRKVNYFSKKLKSRYVKSKLRGRANCVECVTLCVKII